MEKKKIALLSNITIDLLAVRLRKQYHIYIPEGFDTWIQEIISTESNLYKQELDAVVILIDGTEARSWKDEQEGVDRITLWKQAVDTILGRITNVPVFVSTVDFRENRIKALSERKCSLQYSFEWYTFIQDKAEKVSNLYIVDLADIIADLGRNHFYSNKMWYLSSMPYSRDGLVAVAEEIDNALKAAFQPRKKIIALDLDNTLWGGVIGEDGIENIELSEHKEGQRFYDFQRQLLEMKNRGIVLAINSKNNEEDAEAAIGKHPSMLLRDEDFVSHKINWNNKAQNLKEMERELNLTERGFVFIDDNPIEREIVKGECPEVTVPEFPTDTTELIGFAEKIWKEHFRPLKVLTEDVQKTRMYQSETRRKQELNASLNLDDYLSRLEMRVDIHKMRSQELERVTQLCNKTNQFNLTTKRYTRAEIMAIADDPGNNIYVVYCSDKYGDSGLISVIILIEQGAEIYIDTFLMSCRVMGRKLEEVIINEIAAKYPDRKRLIGEYIPTTKNLPVKELYEKLGFSVVSIDEQHKIYELVLDGYKKKAFGNYKEIRFED